MLAALAYAYKTPITTLRGATVAEIGAMVRFLDQLAEATTKEGG